MSDGVDTLIQEVRAKNHRAIARVISFIEDERPEAARCLELLFPLTGRALVVGVTGSPGAGKSTLVDRLAMKLVRSGKSVAIVAVDPSSPFTRGAVLGDRIRMANAVLEESVFVRSMATRGALGGLAPKTSQAVFVLDAAGFDIVIVETVGVGQGEVEIARMADCSVVVLVPGMGDTIQAMKAGILEIADIFVVNKADHQGTDRLERELIGLLDLSPPKDWRPPIQRTVATDGTGLDELAQKISQFKTHAEQSGQAAAHKKQSLEQAFHHSLSEQLSSSVLEFAEQSGFMTEIRNKLATRQTDPASLARDLIARFRLQGK